ncbi:MAG: helix-turn-helix domain-containing protein, partial [Thermoanaerobaculia bacterium]
MVQNPTARSRTSAPIAAAPTADTTPWSAPRGSGADARRREILAAASRLFRREGLASAGMREIAAELGMTAGNLYYYFAD